METTTKKVISVSTLINAPIDRVWTLWTTPKHIAQWNNASDDWHTPLAENDLRVGGKFLFRMEAKDGSMGFDFEGEYSQVNPNEFIEYTIGDGRNVKIDFFSFGNETKVVENFEAEAVNSIELQHDGWQSILNNFKKYAEANR